MDIELGNAIILFTLFSVAVVILIYLAERRPKFHPTEREAAYGRLQWLLACVSMHMDYVDWNPTTDMYEISLPWRSGDCFHIRASVFRDHETFHAEFDDMITSLLIWRGKSLDPKVICICGSTRFWRQQQLVECVETARGNIVLGSGVNLRSDEHVEWLVDVGIMPSAGALKYKLDDFHKHKIWCSEEVFVVDYDGYIGESTRSEIEYAKNLNKPIRYWSQEKEYVRAFENG
jgi:hypothetical protein